MASNDSGVDTNDGNAMEDDTFTNTLPQQVTSALTLSRLFEKHLDELKKNKIVLPPLPLEKEIEVKLTKKVWFSSSKKERKHMINRCTELANERKLLCAASTNNITWLTSLLAKGSNPNASDEHDRTPLHLSSCRGYVDIVKALLEANANPNKTDSLGNTPLHLAVISASSEKFNLVTKMLLKYGGNVNALDRSNRTPLQLIESKLKLMKSRYNNPTPEERILLQNMCGLIQELLVHDKTTPKEKLLEKLRNFRIENTSETEIDDLLSNIQQLSITKK